MSLVFRVILPTFMALLISVKLKILVFREDIFKRYVTSILNFIAKWKVHVHSRPNFYFPIRYFCLVYYPVLGSSRKFRKEARKYPHPPPPTEGNWIFQRGGVGVKGLLNFSEIEEGCISNIKFDLIFSRLVP